MHAELLGQVVQGCLEAPPAAMLVVFLKHVGLSEVLVITVHPVLLGTRLMVKTDVWPLGMKDAKIFLLHLR